MSYYFYGKKNPYKTNLYIVISRNYFHANFAKIVLSLQIIFVFILRIMVEVLVNLITMVSCFYIVFTHFAENKKKNNYAN